MSGRLIQVIPRTQYTISLAASGTQEVILGDRAIDARDAVSGGIVVLVHTKTFSSSTASVAFKINNTFFEPADPTTLWVNSAASAIASTTVAPADTTPQMYLDDMSAPIGPYIRGGFTFSQGANTGSCTFDVTVYAYVRDA